MVINFQSALIQLVVVFLCVCFLNRYDEFLERSSGGFEEASLLSSCWLSFARCIIYDAIIHGSARLRLIFCDVCAAV